MTLDCPNCGLEATHVLWLIADLADNPELRRVLRTMTVECPFCYYDAFPSIPLIVYQGGDVPTLVFVPPEGLAPETADQVRAALLDKFLSQIPDPAQRDRLEAAVTTMSHDGLRGALGDVTGFR